MAVKIMQIPPREPPTAAVAIQCVAPSSGGVAVIVAGGIWDVVDAGRVRVSFVLSVFDWVEFVGSRVGSVLLSAVLCCRGLMGWVWWFRVWI